MDASFDSDDPGVVEFTIKNVGYSFDGQEFTCFGYGMSTQPFDRPRRNQPIEYWKAQLAFRGFSSRGSDIDALKQRLANADTDEMDITVRLGCEKWADVWIQKREKQERARHAHQARPESQREVELDAQRQYEQKAPHRDLDSKWANRIINRRLAGNNPDSFLFELFCNEYGEDEGGPPIELKNMGARYRFALHRYADAYGLYHVTSASGIMVIGSRKNSLADERLRALNLETHRKHGPTVSRRKRRVGDEDEHPEYSSFGVAEEARQRATAKPKVTSASASVASAQQASISLQSRRENEIQRIDRNISRAEGFISAADWTTLNELGVSGDEIRRMSTKAFHSAITEVDQHRLGYADDGEEEDEKLEDEEVEGEDAEVEEEDEEVADKEGFECQKAEDNAKGDTNNEPWDVTGEWEIECHSLRRVYEHQAPYTLQIFSDEHHRHGKAMYGRLSFQEWTGVFRFTSMRHGDDDYTDQYVLDTNDVISAQDPTRCYRWRGKDIQGIIQLGSDNKLYQMTFSDGGDRVQGTWSHPNGNEKFEGVKRRHVFARRGETILREWKKHNQKEYDRANKGRWRS